MECNLKDNKISCTCTYEPCSRKGKCCECVTYHRKLGQIPGCFFTAEAEKTYNRDLNYFIEVSDSR